MRPVLQALTPTLPGPSRPRPLSEAPSLRFFISLRCNIPLSPGEMLPTPLCRVQSRLFSLATPAPRSPHLLSVILYTLFQWPELPPKAGTLSGPPQLRPRALPSASCPGCPLGPGLGLGHRNPGGDGRCGTALSSGPPRAGRVLTPYPLQVPNQKRKQGWAGTGPPRKDPSSASSSPAEVPIS